MRISALEASISAQRGCRATPPIVASFAASDPTSGAGLQADVLSIAALGGHPLTIVTALTVQDSLGVEQVVPVDVALVEAQARAVLADMPVDAFKIGLLGSVDTIAVIARVLAEHPDVPLVLDPVLASGRGDRLADDATIRALGRFLLPRTTVLTPNSLEARRLALDGGTGLAPPLLDECAERLLALGCAHVLITGTHENGAHVINTLYGRQGPIRHDAWERFPDSYHGSGCTLASALATFLARGLPVDEAAYAAQEYTWQTLAAGFRPGKGQYIPRRFLAREAEG